MRYYKTLPLELVDEKRGPLSTAPLVTNRVFNFNLIEDCTVVELYEESIADGALLGVVVVNTEALIFNAVHLGTQSINTRVSSRGVSATRGGKAGLLKR